MTWIELHADAFTNKRICEAATKLTRGDVYKLVGHLGALWTWATDHAEDGDLSHLSDRAIANAAGWTGQPGRFVAVLREVGLIDERSHIRNWLDFAGKLIQRRVRDRIRKRKERDDSFAAFEQELTATQEVSTRTSTTLSNGNPGGTRPDQTVPDLSSKEDDDASASLGQGTNVEDAVRELTASGFRVTPAVERNLRDFEERGVDVALEVGKWCARAREEPPRWWKAALKGWLNRTLDRGESSPPSKSPPPPPSLEELLTNYPEADPRDLKLVAAGSLPVRVLGGLRRSRDVAGVPIPSLRMDRPA